MSRIGIFGLYGYSPDYSLGLEEPVLGLQSDEVRHELLEVLFDDWLALVAAQGEWEARLVQSPV